MRIKLGIIFGGKNIKADESISKTINLVEYIDSNKYEIVPIYIAENKIWYKGKMLIEKDIYNYFNDLKKYAKQICLTKKKNHFLLQTTSSFKREVNYIDLVLPMIDNNDILGYLDTLGIPYIGSKTVDKAFLKTILTANDIKTDGKSDKIYDCIELSDGEDKLFGIIPKDLDLNNIEKITLPDEIQDDMKNITDKLYDLFMIKGLFKVRFNVSSKEKKVYVDSISTCLDIESLYALDKKHKNYTNLIDDIISITIEKYKEHEEIKNS